MDAYLNFVAAVDEILKPLNITDWYAEQYEVVGSTNDVAKELLRSQHRNVMVFAEQQSTGRGTNGREWYSPIGGIWLSLAFSTDAPVVNIASLVAQQLSMLLSDVTDEDCTVKEPNDIIVQGKKVCGILVESVIQGNKLKEVVIGIGLNNVNPIPEEIQDIAISIAELGVFLRTHKLARDIAIEVLFLLRQLHLV